MTTYNKNVTTCFYCDALVKKITHNNFIICVKPIQPCKYHHQSDIKPFNNTIIIYIQLSTIIECQTFSSTIHDSKTQFGNTIEYRKEIKTHAQLIQSLEVNNKENLTKYLTYLIETCKLIEFIIPHYLVCKNTLYEDLYKNHCFGFLGNTYDILN